MMSAQESRRERLERFKNKFRALGRIGRLKEYVRYERAASGALPHPFPEDYVKDARDALHEMLREDYENKDLLKKLLDILRQKESVPFIAPKK